MKDLITSLKKDIPKVKEHIMGAVRRSDMQGWKLPTDEIKEKDNK